MKTNGLFLSLVLLSLSVFSQTEIIYNPKESNFILRNVFFSRTLQLNPSLSAFYTSSFKNLSNGNDLCKKNSKEFSFMANGKPVEGGLRGNMLRYKMHEITNGSDGRKTLKIIFDGRPGANAANLEIELFYEIYPELALTSKWLIIKNEGKKETVITNLNGRMSILKWHRQVGYRVFLHLVMYMLSMANLYINLLTLGEPMMLLSWYLIP